jgi:predicted homoserine dehydrogenase-like protein
VNEIPELFRPKSEGGLLNRRGVVDYARPLKHPDGSIDFDRSVTPGVFLCVYTDHPQVRADLNYLDVTGSDGYYNMYTPYHLVTNEIPLSIVNAVEFSHPTIVPKLGLVTEVFGAAKQKLKAGAVIDGAGGSTVYALNDHYETAKSENVVPLGLLTGATLRSDVPVDAAITYDMVDLVDDTTLYHLRAMQDAGACGVVGPNVRLEGRSVDPPHRVAAE